MTSNTTIENVYAPLDSKEVCWISTICNPRITTVERGHRVFVLTFSFINFRESDIKKGSNLVIIDKTGYDGAIVVDEVGYTSAGIRQLKREREATRLLQRFSSSARARHTSQNEAFRAKIPTVVLECIFEDCGTQFFPLAEWLLHPFQSDHSDRLNTPKVIFDRFYLFEPGNHTLTTILDFQTDQAAGFGNYCPGPEDYMELSITRNYESRPPAPPLPAHAIILITAYALQEHRPFMADWNKTLFSLAFIDRSWVFILHMRWAMLGSGIRDVRAFRQYDSAIAIIRRGLPPYIASLIKGFDINMFTYFPEKQGHIRIVEFAAALIGSSNRLLSIRINGEILLAAMDVLATQECVQTFEVIMAYKPFISLSEVQRAIQLWSQLKILILHLDWEVVLEWKESDDLDQVPADLGTTSFRLLEELSFFKGHLPGNQFVRLLPAAPERLRRLFLYRVFGLTTREISIFFALTHSTLAELQIVESNVRRAVPDGSGASYDYPLDAWVDKMKCLTLAMVTGTVASIPSLSQKSRVAPGHQTKNLLTRDFISQISINCYYTSPDDISNHWTSSDNSDLLVSAINQSCWDKVYITLPYKSKRSNDVWGKAIEAAGKKGMTLQVIDSMY